MGAFDRHYDFSDDQDVASGTLSSGSNVVSTNVAYNTATPTDTWLVNIDHELGGDVEWTVMVSDEAMTGAGAKLKCDLITKNANASLSSGGTVIATIEMPATSAVQTVKSLKIPAGTAIQAYLGVLYTASGGNLTAGHITSHLGPAPIGN
jgi:hypothetical protein